MEQHIHTEQQAQEILQYSNAELLAKMRDVIGALSILVPHITTHQIDSIARDAASEAIRQAKEYLQKIRN